MTAIGPRLRIDGLREGIHLYSALLFVVFMVTSTFTHGQNFQADAAALTCHFLPDVPAIAVALQDQ
ncbi:TPA: hypothetical protein U8177_001762 [Pseudomonas aeruginosa]|nr:hypothetical protein [Pseudomonas aeruginosa]HEN8630594.1 hypothetical protein [Pseudomonas aeruginosa]